MVQAIESREIVRQKDKADQKAILDIIDRKTAEAIAHFRAKGCLVEATRKERIKELTKGKVEGILADQKEGIGIDKPKNNPTTIVSTNKERDEINNQKTHQALKKAGYFSGPDVQPSRNTSVHYPKGYSHSTKRRLTPWTLRRIHSLAQSGADPGLPPRRE